MYSTLISCQDLDNLIADASARIFDCRFALADTEWGEMEYARAHVPGALYAHLDRDLSGPIIADETGRHPLPAVKVFVRKLGEWGLQRDQQIVVYDQSHGGIAARLWWMLRWIGHEAVAVLDGGWAEWSKRALATSAEVPQFQETQYPAMPVADMTVDAEQLDLLRADHRYLVVDSRKMERYLGIHEPIDPVAGHIPGAVNMPFSENVEADGCWKSKQALQDRFVPAVMDKDANQTVFYCGSGVTACHNILAHVHAGLGMPKLYPGSWSEWITTEREIITTEEE